MRAKEWILAFALAFFGAAPAFAAPSASSGNTANQPTPQPQFAVTHHAIRINGNTIHFTATAGSLVLKNQKHQPAATMFFVAFTKDDVHNLATRPIIFLYNGGPGSSSIWLELGAFGPQRVVTTNAGMTPPAPYKLVDNQYSLLNVADLVFVDAPGTGFSHMLAHGKASEFYGINQDGRAFTQFIRRYLNKYHRWNSPKFLLGESYGTTRSAVLSNMLERSGIALNGVILQSCILNFRTASFNTGNDLPYVLFLPSYAAVAWYHKALPNEPPKLRPFLAKVEQFAHTQYMQALYAGSTLSSAERNAVIRKLHEYTGVPESYWRKANLRVNNSQFEKEVLRNRDEVTGRLDARYTGMSVNLLGENQTWDPLFGAISPAFTAAFHHYLIHYLDYQPQRKYKVLSGAVIRHWDWKGKTYRVGGQAWPGSPNVAPDLAFAMTENPNLQVMVNNGYFDLGTPFYATDYTFTHLFDPVSGTAKLMKRVHMFYYKSGHMVYLHVPSLVRYNHNVEHFIAQTLAADAKKR